MYRRLFVCLQSAQSTVDNRQKSIGSEYCRQYLYFILRTLYFVLYTLYFILCTLYFVLYTLYFILCDAPRWGRVMRTLGRRGLPVKPRVCPGCAPPPPVRGLPYILHWARGYSITPSSATLRMQATRRAPPKGLR